MKIPKHPPPSPGRPIRHRLALPRLRHITAPALVAAMLLAGSASAMAQSAPSLMTPGDAAVTGFSGTTSETELAKRFIDLDGPSLQILAGTPVKPVAEGPGNPAAKFQVMAGQIGQVFGIALDDNTVGGQPAPNIYVTATSLFGIQIVTPDADGDGQPERANRGAPGAGFMDGQFGFLDGAGPGTVYKIDGISGEVTVFANITLDDKPNSGPGLGNITFDAKSRQFFVTDLDTGMIHRLDLNGVPAGHYDHGVTGLSVEGLAPVPHNDAARMNVEDPSFDAENPATWGLAAPQRRVFGVAARDGRLYYSVNGPSRQIWSVGIAEDGAFTEDARMEIDVGPGDGQPMITDITFDSEGRIYLAQRGGIKSSFDYTTFAPSGSSKILRYAKAPSGQGWVEVPETYAIGLKPDHLEASGGVAIGNGPGIKACNTLWSTGDNLRPEAVMHGIQGNPLESVRPANVPPVDAAHVDYDGKVNEPPTEGHVGDVEVLRVCEGVPQPVLVPASAPVPVPLGGGYLVPSHWKYGSDGHSKIRSHRKYGSWGHTKRRSHWKCASVGHSKRRSHFKWHSEHHSKRRSHWKFASSEHLKRRSHQKWGSLGHRKRRSHWKFASYEHSKLRSHWKTASREHSKLRSHWKHASREHSKRRSHWKTASREHTKLRSHYKHASREHSKRRSHWKTASREHTKLRSHYKHASREHSKRRSHWKTASREHSKLRSHYKNASREHSKRRSHWKTASREHSKLRSHYKNASHTHSKRRSHWKSASREHSKLRSHNRRISRGVTHNRRVSRGVTHSRRISRGVTHSRRISSGRVPKRIHRFSTRRTQRIHRLRRFHRNISRPQFSRRTFRSGGFGRGGFGGGGRGFRGGFRR